METIKINNYIVLVPTDIIVEYLKYRKLNNQQYYDGVEDDINMHIYNITMWSSTFDVTFEEVKPELEKIAFDLI